VPLRQRLAADQRVGPRCASALPSLTRPHRLAAGPHLVADPLTTLCPLLVPQSRPERFGLWLAAAAELSQPTADVGGRATGRGRAAQIEAICASVELCARCALCSTVH
jgi:hypothetical protein